MMQCSSTQASSKTHHITDAPFDTLGENRESAGKPWVKADEKHGRTGMTTLPGEKWKPTEKARWG